MTGTPPTNNSPLAQQLDELRARLAATPHGPAEPEVASVGEQEAARANMEKRLETRRQEREVESRAAAMNTCGLQPRTLARLAAMNEWPDGGAVADLIYRKLVKGAMVCVCGRVGVGKTLLAAEIMRRWINHQPIGRHVSIYGRLADILESVRVAVFRGGDPLTTLEALQPWVRPPLLVIDELQDCTALYKTEAAHGYSTFKALVDERYGRMLPLLLVTNWTKEEAANSLPSSIVSRIHDKVDGGGFVMIPWKNFREGE